MLCALTRGLEETAQLSGDPTEEQPVRAEVEGPAQSEVVEVGNAFAEGQAPFGLPLGGGQCSLNSVVPRTFRPPEDPWNPHRTEG